MRILLQPGEDVQLVEHEVAGAVDGHGVAQRDRVEPAAAAPPAGGGAELAALLQQVAARLVVQLGGEGTGADPRGVGLQDADDLRRPGVGPTPPPVQAPPATGLLLVTKGYVPWSRSRSVPWAPSRMT